MEVFMKVRKMICVWVAIVLTSAFFGCSNVFDPETNREEIDPTKTQLYIGNVNQGFGEDWLQYGIKPRFEEFYKDTHFEEGKTGVQLVINETDYGTGLISKISGDTNEIYFTESVAYYQFVNADKLLDITDAVTTPLTEYGEERSILDKMNTDAAKYFDTDDTENGRQFQAIPFYETYFTIIYNADLFAQESLYLTTSGSGAWNNPLSWTSDVNAPNISPGPDGDIGTTFDNGLPATYDEFFQLCEKAKQSGLIPLSWNGASGSYPGNFLMNLTANASGYDEMMLNYSFDGVSKTLVDSVNYDNDTHTGTLQMGDALNIELSNGYELSRQAGKYYALEFFDRVLKGGYYNTTYLGNSTVSHIEAQNAFIRTAEFGGNSNGKDTAMLIDGTWWMNEAKNTFNSLVGVYGEKAGTMQRNFALMPLPMPRADFERPGETGTQSVFLDKHMSACFINANIAPHKIDLAKKLLRFCHTDESIVEFTKYTNTIKPYSYDHTEADLKGFTPYARSVITLKQHSKTVPAYSKSKIYVNDASGLTNPSNFWAKEGQNAPEAGLAPSGGETAKTYFEGMITYNSKTYWDSKYKLYY